MTQIATKQIDEIFKRHSTINEDDCPQFTIVMDNNRISKVRASKFIVPQRMSKRLTFAFKSRISASPGDKRTSFLDNFAKNDMIINQIKHLMDDKPDNVLFDFDINEKRDQERAEQKMKEKQEKQRKRVSFVGYNTDQKITAIMKHNEQPQSESDSQPEEERRTFTYDDDINRKSEDLLLGKIKDMVQKMTKEKFNRLIWEEKQKLLELSLKINKSEIQIIDQSPIKQILLHLFSCPLQNHLESSPSNPNINLWLYEQLKSSIVYIEEGHIRHSDYDRALEQLIITYADYAHRSHTLTKSYLELLKQTLLYYKLHHYSLANVDAKFQRFYQMYDLNMTILMADRSLIQRHTLQADTFKLFLEKGVSSNQKEEKKTSTKKDSLKKSLDSSQKKERGTESWKKKATKDQMKNIYGMPKSFKL